MTQSPHSQDNPQPQSPPPAPLAAQPMSYYPAPGSYPGQADAKPSWPVVVGIISLCIAGLFGLMAIVGLVMQAAGLGNAQQQKMMETVPDWVKSLQFTCGLFNIATYVLLAFAGAALLKRRRRGRTLHLAYALLGIVAAIAGTAVGVAMMSHMQMPEPAPANMQAIVKISMIVSLILGLLFALAYPVFLLIWFSRAKVKKHVQTWQS